MKKLKNVTINKKQKLYVIRLGDSYSCYGFDVVIKRRNALAQEMELAGFNAGRGTMKAYDQYMELIDIARKKNEATGWRSTSELHPQLIGKEGKRVEVITESGNKSRFYVGKSTGWIPCHLEVAKSNSTGGGQVTSERFKSVKVLY